MKSKPTPMPTQEQREAMQRAKHGGWLLRGWIEPPRNQRDEEIIVPHSGRLVRR